MRRTRDSLVGLNSSRGPRKGGAAEDPRNLRFMRKAPGLVLDAPDPGCVRAVRVPGLAPVPGSGFSGKRDKARFGNDVGEP
jgi:hypothetical protein